MSVRRWWWVAAVTVALGLGGCTTSTLSPTDTPSSGSVPAGTTASATSSTTTTSATTSSAGDGTPAPTGTDGSTAESSTTTTPTTATPTTATYTPPADVAAVDGDCPYLPRDQVQSDTGQRTGTPQIRAATPQPVCEFIRNDGDYLATVRVLQLDTDATAVAAVDFYVPRDTSNPETRPAGWTGGSLATADGSTYGVSKGTYAVIAQTNQKQSVYARLLGEHASANLGL